MRVPPLPALLLATGLVGCAAQPGGSRGSCGPREVTFTNASAVPVEQLYLGSATAGWGEDLLTRGALPSGGSTALRLPGPGPHGVRAVWANGRAAELPGVDGCSTTRITVLDAALRAE